VTIRTRKGRLAQISTSRRAAYGYDQRFEVLGSKGMLQCGNHRPTLAHFFECLQSGEAFRTTIEDAWPLSAWPSAATAPRPRVRSGGQVDVLDLARGSWDGKTVLAHAFEVKGDRIANLALSLLDRGARGHAARQVRDVRGVVALCLLDDDGVPHG
jgi:predicted dehydrogenase